MMKININNSGYKLRFIVVCFVFFVTRIALCQDAQVVFLGNEFAGGGLNPKSGVYYYDRVNVNAVYAAETGEKSVMKVQFNLDKLPSNPVLKLQGRYSGGHLPIPDCPISISLNKEILYSGHSRFSNKDWSERSFAIPPGVLKKEGNELVIHNLAEKGGAGRPPWFMVGIAGIGQDGFVLREPTDIFKQLSITLPDKKIDMRTPKPGEKGFSLRGTKGWAWTPEQTITEIPYLKQFNMNFFMNCYLSMFDYPNDNQWWKPFETSFKTKYEEIVRLCRDNDIEFCFAMNPNLYSSRHVDYKSKKDLEDLWQHYQWMAKLGVNWFSVCLDDITTGLDATAQAEFVNALYKHLQKINPNAKLIFCPTIYASTYKVEGIDDNTAYLHTIAKVLHPDIYCFWTGDFVCGPISIEKAKEYKALIGHRLIVWDNYPVNDAYQSMHLGPVVLRDKDLPEVCEGYMANAMYTQSEFNRIPTYTCADYALNPVEYDPLRSIGQAIIHLTDNREQAQTLKDVVEVYYGFLLGSDNYKTSLNTARVSFQQLLAMKQGNVPAKLFKDHLRDIYNRLEKQFPEHYQAERKTILADIEWMEDRLAMFD